MEHIQVDSYQLGILNLVQSVRTQVDTDGGRDGCEENPSALEAEHVHRLVEETSNAKCKRNSSNDEHDAAPEQLGLDGVLVKFVGRNRLLALQRNPYEQDNQRDEYNTRTYKERHVGERELINNREREGTDSADNGSSTAGTLPQQTETEDDYNTGIYEG